MSLVKITDAFREHLEKKCTELGSQSALAAAAGVTPGTISKILSAENKDGVRMDTAEKLEEVTGWSFVADMTAENAERMHSHQSGELHIHIHGPCQIHIAGGVVEIERDEQ